MIGARRRRHIGLRRAVAVHRRAYAAAPLRLAAYGPRPMTDARRSRTVLGVTIGRHQLHPRAVDAALVLAVAAATALTISVAQEDDATRTPDLFAYALGLLLAALLLARRRRPLLVLLGSIGVLMTYFALNYPAFSPAVPLAAAAYSAAVAGRLAPAAALLTVPLLLGLLWQSLFEGTSVAEVIGTGTLADAALLAAVLLLGEAVRSRRGWAEEVRARLERVEAEREREARRRVEQERLRIARELHDVMAHTVAAMNVQAAVALDTLDRAPEQARGALATLRAQGGEAAAELRAAVGLLRDGDPASGPPRAPAPRLQQLDELVRRAAAAGVEVRIDRDGAARSLPGAVDLTGYRIVQESLTNVVRHAGAASARVLLRYEPDALVVEVEDDGRGGDGGAVAHGGDGRGPAGEPGFGLLGMRERAAAVGGTLEAGPAGGRRGFRVRARLPTEAAAR